MLLWPLFIMIRLRFTDHSPGKYYYLHHDSAKTRAQNCHLGFPSCHPLTHRTDIELVFFCCCCFAQFPLEPISNIRSSRKIRKDNVDSKRHIKERKCWTKKRQDVGECLYAFPYWQLGPMGRNRPGFRYSDPPACWPLRKERTGDMGFW